MKSRNIEILDILSSHWSLNNDEIKEMNTILEPTDESDELENRAASLLKCAVLLDILYGSPLSRQWIKLPNSNPQFDGCSPLSKILTSRGSEIPNLLRLLQSRAS